MESKFKESQPTIQFIQASLRRMAAEITTLLDSKDGHAILLTQIITERPTSTQKHIAYLDMRRVNNGTLGLELSQARTVQIHQIDCSSTCLQITNVLMDSDGTSSPAMAAGLKKGDIITRCGRTPVTSIQSLLDNVRQAQKDKMKFLVLEYCRLPRFGFLQRDIENARAQVEEKCYQTRLNVMLEQHVNNEELRNLSPSELYALFPSPFSRSGGTIANDSTSKRLAWTGRIIQTLPVVTDRNFLRFAGKDGIDSWQKPAAVAGTAAGKSGVKSPRGSRNSFSGRSPGGSISSTYSDEEQQSYHTSAGAGKGLSGGAGKIISHQRRIGRQESYNRF